MEGFERRGCKNQPLVFKLRWASGFAKGRGCWRAMTGM